MKRAIYLSPLLFLAISILVTSCSQGGPESQPNTTTPSSNSTNVPSAESVPKTIEQLKAIISNAKRWKAAGHSYADLNFRRAIADDLLPKEMVDRDGIRNLFGGPVDIGPAPETVGVPDTFLVVFSGVPNESCVKLAFPANDNFIVYAGTYQKTPASEEQAKSLCTTGNMWFVAK